MEYVWVKKTTIKKTKVKFRILWKNSMKLGKKKILKVENVVNRVGTENLTGFFFVWWKKNVPILLSKYWKMGYVWENTNQTNKTNNKFGCFWKIQCRCAKNRYYRLKIWKPKLVRKMWHPVFFGCQKKCRVTAPPITYVIPTKKNAPQKKWKMKYVWEQNKKQIQKLRNK